MFFLLKPLLNENYNEHCRHNKIESFGVEGDEGTEDSADGCSGNPIALVKKRNRKVKFSSFNSFRNGGGTVYGKSFVRKSEDEIKFFKPGVFIFFKHFCKRLSFAIFKASAILPTASL